jgi:hypothetical protein
MLFDFLSGCRDGLCTLTPDLWSEAQRIIEDEETTPSNTKKCSNENCSNGEYVLSEKVLTTTSHSPPYDAEQHRTAPFIALGALFVLLIICLVSVSESKTVIPVNIPGGFNGFVRLNKVPEAVPEYNNIYWKRGLDVTIMEQRDKVVMFSVFGLGCVIAVALSAGVSYIHRRNKKREGKKGNATAWPQGRVDTRMQWV